MDEMHGIKKRIKEYVDKCGNLHFLRCLWAFITGYERGKKAKKPYGF